MDFYLYISPIQAKEVQEMRALRMVAVEEVARCEDSSFLSENFGLTNQVRIDPWYFIDTKPDLAEMGFMSC
ncbi:hypothetical protein HO133_003675 [Letharia lupina]|uniref:Uncharacterized protein n=1 Tax=Letharia lupina TaxID=560253 RepID=A0A8H6CAI8_9LECA|nr:uncharacterized protein HO133_003675 [Letharia lupina]KAF6219850.1 hypothetical protein HO133_003675 [Letharia lupina]